MATGMPLISQGPVKQGQPAREAGLSLRSEHVFKLHFTDNIKEDTRKNLLLCLWCWSALLTYRSNTAFFFQHNPTPDTYKQLQLITYLHLSYRPTTH